MAELLVSTVFEHSNAIAYLRYRPIFTDAVNNTGLATVTWLNLTDNEQSVCALSIDF